MPQRNNLFQDVVARVYRHLFEDAPITESAMVMDPFAETLREVDILIEDERGGVIHRIGVEATAKSGPADVQWVEQLLAKHEDLGTDLVVLVAEHGVSAPGRRKAAARGALVITPGEIDLFDAALAGTLLCSSDLVGKVLGYEITGVFIQSATLTAHALNDPSTHWSLPVVGEDGEDLGGDGARGGHPWSLAQRRGTDAHRRHGPVDD